MYAIYLSKGRIYSISKSENEGRILFTYYIGILHVYSMYSIFCVILH